MCKCYISQIKYYEDNKEEIIWIRAGNFIQNSVVCWACIHTPGILGSWFFLHSSCSFSPLFGKQLSQRSESPCPQLASLSPCRLPRAVRNLTYCITLAHLAALLSVMALWGHWVLVGGGNMLCPAASLSCYAVVCQWRKSIWEKDFSNKVYVIEKALHLQIYL